MSYQRVNWAIDIPLSEGNLNIMDAGIERTHARSMTTAQRNALAGADLFTGRMIWNTNTGALEIWNGSSWISQGAPAVRVFPTVNQTFPINTFTIVNFGGEFFDNANMHGTVVNPSRLHVPVPGIYHITGRVTLSDTVGELVLRLRRNGTFDALDSRIIGSRHIQISDLIHADALDFFQLNLWHNSSGPRDIVLNVATENSFSMVRMSD